MLRMPRGESLEGIYHIINRGSQRKNSGSCLRKPEPMDAMGNDLSVR